VIAKNCFILSAIKTVLAIIGYACYFLSIAVLLILIVPLFLVLLFSSSLFNACFQAIFHAYAFFLTRQLLPFLQVYSIVELSGFENIDLKRSSLYVANHRGRIDALLLFSILRNTGALIKSKYAVLPLYKLFIAFLNFVPIGPSSPQALAVSLEKCKKILNAGKSLLIFPEGSRASSGRLLPFKELAFRLSKDLSLPVVPVIIHSDYSFMAKRPGSIFPQKKLSFTIRFLGPLFPDKNESIVDFSCRVRGIMAATLSLLDKGTEWEV
jgi:1-acyl-sn-glycerol-3-phosphate acyltransferase